MKEVPMSISKLENARPTEVTDKINEIIKKLDDDSQWKVFTPTTGTIDTGTWAQNSIVQMQAWADIITNAGSTIKNAAMLLIPKWGSVGTPATATSCKFSHSFPGAPDITITIPAGNILIVSFGSSGGVQEYACVPSSHPYKVVSMDAGTTLADDGFHGSRDIIVNPKYIDETTGFGMPDSDIHVWAVNGVVKIYPSWLQESVESSLKVTIPSGSGTIEIIIPYHCYLEVSYRTDKLIGATHIVIDADYAVTKIADGAVETSKLDDEAVTLAKLDADVKRDLFTVNSQRFSPDGETSGIMILPRALTLNRMLHIAINTNLWVWSSSAVQFSIIVGTETYTNLSNWTIYNGSSIRFMDVAVTADMVDMAVSIVLNTANVTAGSLWVTVQQRG
jgi:hypothetical protein